MGRYLHYVPAVFETASRVVAKIGAFAYVAAHLRRNDFQYRQAGTASDGLAERLGQALKPGEPLYIATDELDPKYVADFAKLLPGHKVYSLRNFTVPKGPFNGLKFPQVSWKLTGLTEQVICTGARIFFSMPSSTFSGHIKTMRQYIMRASKVDMQGRSV